MGVTSMVACPHDKLFEHFVVCGLTGQSLQTVQGEPGFVGGTAKYKPSLIDHFPHVEDPKLQPPPQLSTVRPERGIHKAAETELQ